MLDIKCKKGILYTVHVLIKYGQYSHSVKYNLNANNLSDH